MKKKCSEDEFYIYGNMATFSFFIFLYLHTYEKENSTENQIDIFLYNVFRNEILFHENKVYRWQGEQSTLFIYIYIYI